MRNNMISNVLSRLDNIARYGNAAEQMDLLTSDELRILKDLVHDVSLEFKARRYQEEENAD